MKDGKFTAEDICALLNKRFSDGRQWLCATEVGNTTGGGKRRLDFVAANCYAGEGFGIHAFEVKISKSDLRNELFDPSKHNIFFPEIDYYSIVAPDYVLDAEYCSIVPKNWGIYKATAGTDDKKSQLKVFRKPLALHDEHTRTISRAFAFELIRCMKYNGQFHGDDEKNAQLRAEYDRGVADGRWEATHGTDYKKLYEEQKAKLIDAMNALQTLHINPYCLRWEGGSFVEAAMKKEAERQEERNIADAIKCLRWDKDRMHRLVKDFDELIGPFIEAQESAKHQVVG